MTSGASRCSFSKDRCCPLISSLSLSNGRSHHYLNLFVCWNTRTQGLLVLQTILWSSLHMQWQILAFPTENSISPAAEYKNGEPNQQRGHLVYRGGAHKSSTVDAHIIDSISMCHVTVHMQLQGTQIKQCCEHHYCPETQIRTDKQ